jgi:hypothetical protein
MKAEERDASRSLDELHRCGPPWIHFDGPKLVAGRHEIDAANSHQREGIGNCIHQRNRCGGRVR